MKTGCMGKFNTKNLPAPTDLTENPYEKKKTVFCSCNSKIGSRGTTRNSNKVVPREPIFEKCSHLREKQGVLTQIRTHGK
jgi:hypothetical protein